MTKVTLYLDDAVWRAFRIACLEHGTSASKEVSRLMQSRLHTWSTTTTALKDAGKTFLGCLILWLSLMLLSCTQALTPALPDVHTGTLTTTMTKEALARRYGQPADVLYLPDDQSTWVYVAMTSTPHAASFIPFVGLVAAGSTMDIRQLRIHFAGLRFVKAEQDQLVKYQNMYAGLTSPPPTFAVEQAHVQAEMEALGRPFDPAAWASAQRALRVWWMLQE